MEKTPIERPGSKPIAPYTPGIEAGGVLFISGQVGFDPVKKVFYGDDLASQVRGAMENLREVLELGGSSMDKVVKTTIYMQNVDEFGSVNELYGSYFPDIPPARTCIQARLPKGALFVIEAIAIK